MPESSPPPPTAGQHGRRGRGLRVSSSPVVPAPSTVSGWSKAWIGSAPRPAAQAWLAASASA